MCLAVPAGAGARINPSVSVAPVLTGTPGTNGWYRSNVGVNWQISPLPVSESSGCLPGTISTEGHTHIVCTVTWTGFSPFSFPLDIFIDKTPPTVHAVPSRKPDANGWYNKPFPVGFAGTDTTSGVASCSSASYSGTANADASVTGTCTDKAGNVGHATYRFAYDSTPPTIGPVTVKHGDRNVSLTWTTSAGTLRSEVTRTGGTRGPAKVLYQGAGHTVHDKGLGAGVKYRYTVSAVDEAANISEKTVAVTATGRLLNPAPGEPVASRPRLSWLPVKGATYYGVQLIRSKRILSAWPTGTTFELPKKWVSHGHHYRLRPGVYRWYVWPGFKKRALARYGHLIGSSSFVYGRR